MRITLRWGRNRDRQPIALLGLGGVRAAPLGGLRHHAPELDYRASTLRSLLLRPVRRWSFPRGMGDGADQTVGDVGRFPTGAYRGRNATFPAACKISTFTFHSPVCVFPRSCNRALAK